MALALMNPDSQPTQPASESGKHFKRKAWAVGATVLTALTAGGLIAKNHSGGAEQRVDTNHPAAKVPVDLSNLKDPNLMSPATGAETPEATTSDQTSTSIAGEQNVSGDTFTQNPDGSTAHTGSDVAPFSQTTETTAPASNTSGDTYTHNDDGSTSHTGSDTAPYDQQPTPTTTPS